MAIDYLKGYPWNCISHQATLKSDEEISAGMLIKVNSSGQAVRCDGTAGEASYFAKEDDTAKDVIFTKKLPYVMSNVVVLTDQFDGAISSYTEGDNLAAGDTLLTGQVVIHPGTGTKPIIGKYVGTRTRNSVVYMAVSKFD